METIIQLVIIVASVVFMYAIYKSINEIPNKWSIKQEYKSKPLQLLELLIERPLHREEINDLVGVTNSAANLKALKLHGIKIKVRWKMYSISNCPDYWTYNGRLVTNHNNKKRQFRTD